MFEKKRRKRQEAPAACARLAARLAEEEARAGAEDAAGRVNRELHLAWCARAGRGAELLARSQGSSVSRSAEELRSNPHLREIRVSFPFLVGENNVVEVVVVGGWWFLLLFRFFLRPTRRSLPTTNNR